MPKFAGRAAIAVRPTWIGVALALLILTGCGTPTYPVDGEVAYADGKPFPGGRIEIESQHPDMMQRVNASAEISAEGKFNLKAPEGEYRALVTPPAPPPNSKSTRPLAPLHVRFRSYDQSGLLVKVMRDASQNRVKLVVEK